MSITNNIRMVDNMREQLRNIADDTATAQYVVNMKSESPVEMAERLGKILSQIRMMEDQATNIIVSTKEMNSQVSDLILSAGKLLGAEKRMSPERAFVKPDYTRDAEPSDHTSLNTQTTADPRT